MGQPSKRRGAPHRRPAGGTARRGAHRNQSGARATTAAPAVAAGSGEQHRARRTPGTVRAHLGPAGVGGRAAAAVGGACRAGLCDAGADRPAAGARRGAGAGAGVAALVAGVECEKHARAEVRTAVSRRAGHDGPGDARRPRVPDCGEDVRRRGLRADGPRLPAAVRRDELRRPGRRGPAKPGVARAAARRQLLCRGSDDSA